MPGRLARQAHGRFDAAGAVALSLLLGSTAWLLNPGNAPGWAVPAAAVTLTALTFAFIRYELRQEDPVL
ncbi:MAG TPA: hypothetical protein VE780_04565 [Thermoleophilaceae bacterium]|jgi:hypothetical protein|nr:hypothetical protein [Thermoleophilaceae bacterium]